MGVCEILLILHVSFKTYMNTDPRKDTEAIQKLFEGKPSNIVIFGHTHPDGDAVGAGLALREFLTIKGHNVHFILPDDYPEFLSWMPEAQSILIHENDEKQIEALINKAEILVFVDLNSPSRVESLEQMITKTIHSKTTVLFDHHINPDNGFTHMFWMTDVSSTSELLFDFFCETGNKHLITKSMAENLYVGIMTDTGSFSYSCNNPGTYLAVSYFFTLGIDGSYIHQQVYNTFTEDRLRLLGFSLSQRLTVNRSSGGAYIALSAYDLEKFNYHVGDTEGLVNFTMSMQGIYFGALITDLKKYIKISLRSEGLIDVNIIARQFFNGGGHRNAAGGYFYGSLSEACDIMDEIISKHIESK